MSTSTRACGHIRARLIMSPCTIAARQMLRSHGQPGRRGTRVSRGRRSLGSLGGGRWQRRWRRTCSTEIMSGWPPFLARYNSSSWSQPSSGGRDHGWSVRGSLRMHIGGETVRTLNWDRGGRSTSFSSSPAIRATDARWRSGTRGSAVCELAAKGRGGQMAVAWVGVRAHQTRRGPRS